MSVLNRARPGLLRATSRATELIPEQRESAEMTLGAKCAPYSFRDHDPSLAQWNYLAARRLTFNHIANAGPRLPRSS
jgi:hypothetical protein